MFATIHITYLEHVCNKSKIMRMKYLVTLAMFTFFFANHSSAQLRIGAGPVVGYGTEFFTGINLSAVYVGEGSLDFGAGYTYWMANEKFMALDFDAYYLMKIVGYNDDVYISPFGGINIARFDPASDGSSIGELDFSINLGVSIKKEIGDRMLFFEPKVLLGYPDFVLKAGIMF